jgi:NhaP-type Na+/H+ or K+/H+ antiporter
LAVLLGLWLLLDLDWAMLVVVACVVMPVDFAPAASILRDERIPERVRDLLNVEGGYNDGIVSPLFIFALVLAGDTSHAVTAWDALSSAVPQAIKGIVVGICVGAVLAGAANVAGRRGFMTGQSRRLILVAAPLLSYGLSVGIGGNGFVSAFVCGIAIRYSWHTPGIRDDLELIDDIGFVLTAAMWFVIGAVAVLALSSVPWRVMVFCEVLGGSAGPLSADAFVVDVPPETVVVVGIRDLDHRAAPLGQGEPTCQFQLFGVDVEPIDAVEDSFGVIDDATHGWGVTVRRLQGCNAPQ